MKFYIKLGGLSLFLLFRVRVSRRFPFSSPPPPPLRFPFPSCRRFFSHARLRPLYIYVPIDRYVGVCIYIDIAVSAATTRDIYAISGGMEKGCTSRQIALL